MDRVRQSGYFLMIPESIASRRDLSFGAKLLYAKISDYAKIRNNGWAWPSLQRLADDLGTTKKTVIRCKQELISNGLIEVSTGDGRGTNRYHFTARSGIETTPQEDRSGVESIPQTIRSGVETTPQSEPKESVVVSNLHPCGVETTPQNARCGVESTPYLYHITNTNEQDQSISSKSSKSPKRRIATKIVLAIYDAYPKHVGKKAALAKIRKALKTVEPDYLLAKVRDYAKSVEAKRGTDDWQYVPHPATWFNQGRWEDENTEQAKRQRTRELLKGWENV